MKRIQNIHIKLDTPRSLNLAIAIQITRKSRILSHMQECKRS